MGRPADPMAALVAFHQQTHFVFDLQTGWQVEGADLRNRLRNKRRRTDLCQCVVQVVQ